MKSHIPRLRAQLFHNCLGALFAQDKEWQNQGGLTIYNDFYFPILSTYLGDMPEQFKVALQKERFHHVPGCDQATCFRCCILCFVLYFFYLIYPKQRCLSAWMNQ